MELTFRNYMRCVQADAPRQLSCDAPAFSDNQARTLLSLMMQSKYADNVTFATADGVCNSIQQDLMRQHLGFTPHALNAHGCATGHHQRQCCTSSRMNAGPVLSALETMLQHGHMTMSNNTSAFSSITHVEMPSQQPNIGISASNHVMPYMPTFDINSLPMFGSVSADPDASDNVTLTSSIMNNPCLTTLLLSADAQQNVRTTISQAPIISAQTTVESTITPIEILAQLPNQCIRESNALVPTTNMNNDPCLASINLGHDQSAVPQAPFTVLETQTPPRDARQKLRIDTNINPDLSDMPLSIVSSLDSGFMDEAGMSIGSPMSSSPSSLLLSFPETSMSSTSSPKSPKTSTTPRRKPRSTDGHGSPVSRPRNAFIIYRTERHGMIASQHPQLTIRDISKLVAQAWRSEPEEVRNRYKAMADKEKAMHALLYPDFKFRRRTDSEIVHRGVRRQIQLQKKHDNV